jgi:hypothetical protein
LHQRASERGRDGEKMAGDGRDSVGEAQDEVGDDRGYISFSNGLAYTKGARRTQQEHAEYCLHRQAIISRCGQARGIRARQRG